MFAMFVLGFVFGVVSLILAAVASDESSGKK